MADQHNDSTGRQSARSEIMDPLQAILSDPESHLSDILYLYFRIYKKRLLWNLMKSALETMNLSSLDTLFLADIGASMGFDLIYLCNQLTNNFRKSVQLRKMVCSLIEGDLSLIERGNMSLREALRSPQIEFDYYHQPLVEGIPLADSSQQLVLCSEVVEHLEHPQKLLKEIYRITSPGGFLILTTDNCPSFLQYIRRVPVLLKGKYQVVYARPSKDETIESYTEWQGKQYPIYGHINLNPTSVWETMSKQCGFRLQSYGTYESIRRGGGPRSPLFLALYFILGAAVYHLLPRCIGRFFGDTTALLLRKPLS